MKEDVRAAGGISELISMRLGCRISSLMGSCLTGPVKGRKKEGFEVDKSAGQQAERNSFCDDENRNSPFLFDFDFCFDIFSIYFAIFTNSLE